MDSIEKTNYNHHYQLNSKYLLPILMIYLMVTLAADVVAYKFIQIGPLVESGATLVFPITYLLGDVVTEIYGYAIARKFIWLNLICELIFSVIIFIIIHLDPPSFSHNQAAFNTVLGNTMRFVTAGIIANIISDFLNIYLISKWKVLLKGRHFWFRSLASTAISEFFLVIITGFTAFTGTIALTDVVHIAASAYILEIFYALLFVWPGWILIVYLKKSEKIDVFDHGINYNIFRY